MKIRSRDSATGNDCADQRYYSNQFGRFMTPDPSHSSAGRTDPGSWNRYAYTRGDPVNRLDPDGLADFSIDVYAFLQLGGVGGGGVETGSGVRPMPWDEMGKKAYLALLAANRADNKAAAQDRLKKIAAGFDPSGKCLDFLHELVNTMKADVSVDTLISEIKETAALAANQIYDGVTSGTELTEEKFPGERDRTGMSTVGQWFGSAGNNAIALSQFNDAAIFMNLNLSYGDQYRMGILLHELLHKESVGGGSSHPYINFALNAVDAPPGAVRQTDDMGSRIGQICFH
jgi:RHS repeat-associated protein